MGGVRSSRVKLFACDAHASLMTSALGFLPDAQRQNRRARVAKLNHFTKHHHTTRGFGVLNREREKRAGMREGAGASSLCNRKFLTSRKCVPPAAGCVCVCDRDK